METGLGQVAKLLGARAEVRLTRAFGSGTVRRRRCRREGGLEMTVREQQGRRMTHENGKGEMERHDMRTASTSSHACTRYLYVTQRNCVRKMCVRHGVSVHPSSHTQSLPLCGCEILSLKNFKLRHSMSTLISPTRTWSTSLLSTNHQMYELMLLGFPRHALLLIVDDAFVWNLDLSSGSPRSTISNCVRAI